MYASFFMALALAVGAPGVKDAPKKEVSLVGDWVGERAVEGGREKPVAEGGVTMTFTADGKFVIREGKRLRSEGGTYNVDKKKDPAGIDMLASPESGRPVVKGIFKIDGDTLTLCFAGGKDADRPTEFESPEGSPTTIMIFKRGKKD